MDGCQFELAEGTELRVDANRDTIQFTIVEGSAELFGSPLQSNALYTFPVGWKGAIYCTSPRCKVAVYGTEKTTLTSSSTPTYTKILDDIYSDSSPLPASKAKMGRRLVICGPSDTGKTTAVKVLCNKAIQQGKKTILVDCCLGQNMIGMAGTVGFAILDKPIDPQYGLLASDSKSVVFFFGLLTPNMQSATGNIGLYYLSLSCLASYINHIPNIEDYLVVINTMGWTSGIGYEVLVKTINIFRANGVYVLHEDKLFKQLQADLPGAYTNPTAADRQDDDNDEATSDDAPPKPPTGPTVAFLKRLDKSSGVGQRDKATRRELRMARIAEYFGGLNNTLTPFVLDMPTKKYTLVRVFWQQVAKKQGKDDMEVDETQPQTPTISVNVLDAAELKGRLENVVLGVSSATELDLVKCSPVVGFLSVVSVREAYTRLTVVSPCPDPPARKFLIVSDIRWDGAKKMLAERNIDYPTAAPKVQEESNPQTAHANMVPGQAPLAAYPT
eukprot:TRINITY_DN114781_c0_g1_i1.p1 TRINITY_DN114781_c0_g1~~TRINITY_DN114781_c0_g1_i1.p1  ORF type:complete len:507 (+),score=41.67 TRINITY_DN114781_c0_g1_i1:23-1522(+)